MNHALTAKNHSLNYFYETFVNKKNYIYEKYVNKKNYIYEKYVNKEKCVSKTKTVQLVRKDMDVNKYDRLSNITLRHTLK